MKTQFTLSLCLLAALVTGCGPAAPSAQVNEGLASPQIVAGPSTPRFLSGDTAQADVPLIGIVDGRAWRIMANYKQSFIRGFKPGDTAWIWLDSQPWHLHRAQVAGIARAAARRRSGECQLSAG